MDGTVESRWVGGYSLLAIFVIYGIPVNEQYPSGVIAVTDAWQFFGSKINKDRKFYYVFSYFFPSVSCDAGLPSIIHLDPF
jgi:hypothetical protein